MYKNNNYLYSDCFHYGKKVEIAYLQITVEIEKIIQPRQLTKMKKKTQKAKTNYEPVISTVLRSQEEKGKYKGSDFCDRLTDK